MGLPWKGEVQCSILSLQFVFQSKIREVLKMCTAYLNLLFPHSFKSSSLTDFFSLSPGSRRDLMKEEVNLQKHGSVIWCVPNFELGDVDIAS